MVQNLRLWDVEVEVVWQVILAFEAQHPPHWVHLGRGRGRAAGRRETHFTIYNLCDASVLLHCVSVKSTQWAMPFLFMLHIAIVKLNTEQVDMCSTFHFVRYFDFQMHLSVSQCCLLEYLIHRILQWIEFRPIRRYIRLWIYFFAVNKCNHSDTEMQGMNRVFIRILRFMKTTKHFEEIDDATEL